MVSVDKFRVYPPSTFEDCVRLLIPNDLMNDRRLDPLEFKELRILTEPHRLTHYDQICIPLLTRMSLNFCFQLFVLLRLDHFEQFCDRSTPLLRLI